MEDKEGCIENEEDEDDEGKEGGRGGHEKAEGNIAAKEVEAEEECGEVRGEGAREPEGDDSGERESGERQSCRGSDVEEVKQKEGERPRAPCGGGG